MKVGREETNESRFDHYGSSRWRAHRNICRTRTGGLSARKRRRTTCTGRYGLHRSIQELWGLRCEQFAQWFSGGAIPKLLQTTLA